VVIAAGDVVQSQM
jgi:hypothetical protein